MLSIILHCTTDSQITQSSRTYTRNYDHTINIINAGGFSNVYVAILMWFGKVAWEVVQGSYLRLQYSSGHH